MNVYVPVNSIINGVSQQAENLRYSSQCSEQINAVSSVLEGVTKRPPFEHVAKLTLTGADVTSLSFHAIDRSLTERFIMSLGSAYGKINKLDGTAVPIKNSLGDDATSSDLAYLTCTDPKNELKVITVADYSLVVNTSKTVALSSTVGSTRPPEALVFVKQLRRGADYTVRLFNDAAGSTANYVGSVLDVETNIDRTDPTGPLVADQGEVADKLRIALENVGANAHYSLSSDSGLIYIRPISGSTPFRVEVKCSITEGMIAVQNTVQSFTILPKRAWHGFVIKVVGDPDTGSDDYYAKFVAQTPTAPEGWADGQWEETKAGGLQNEFDASTLPHALVNHGTYFEFKPLPWAPRAAGDATSNPVPSMVGRKVQSVFFWRNRLGLLSGENVLLSQASEFWTFWRSTVIQVLDSDTIDVAGTSSRVSTLNNAVAMSEQMLLFAPSTQFALAADGLLTPSTTSIKEVSSHANIDTVCPVGLGNNVYFAFQRGMYSGLAEYGVSSITNLFEAEDVSEQAPSYVKGTVDTMVAMDTESLILVKTRENPQFIYCYRFFKKDGQRLQSAWFKFDCTDPVRGFVVIDKKAYCVISRPDGLCIERLDFTPLLTDDNSPIRVCLDRRMSESQFVSRSYDSGLNQTTITLPVTLLPSKVAVVVRSTPEVTGGITLEVRSATGTTVVVGGNHTATPLWAGQKYKTALTFSRANMVERKPSGGTANVVSGRFQVRYATLAFAKSLLFNAAVLIRGGQLFNKLFTVRNLGTNSTVVGSIPPPEDGSFRFPVFSKNDEVSITIENETPYPSAWLSIDWEALYNNRATRV